MWPRTPGRPASRAGAASRPSCGPRSPCSSSARSTCRYASVSGRIWRGDAHPAEGERVRLGQLLDGRVELAVLLPDPQHALTIAPPRRRSTLVDQEVCVRGARLHGRKLLDHQRGGRVGQAAVTVRPSLVSARSTRTVSPSRISPAEQRLGQLVADRGLDQPAQRAGAVDRVVAVARPATPGPASVTSRPSRRSASRRRSRSSWMSTMDAQVVAGAARGRPRCRRAG